MSKLFISYNRESVEIVRNLAADLESLGHEVWFDQDLSGGQAWWDKILEKVRNCELFVFALAPGSLGSTACQREYQYASELGKPILPILVADGVSANILPPALAAIQIVEYRDQADRDAALRLARAVMSTPPPRPLPSPLPAPPDVPISYLGSLTEQIAAPSLSTQEQAALVIDLKQALRDPDTSKDARDLLMRLRKRRDLFVATAEEIDEALGVHPSSAPREPSSPSPSTNNNTQPRHESSKQDPSWLNRNRLPVAVASFVALAIVAYLVWSRPGVGPSTGDSNRVTTEEVPPPDDLVPATTSEKPAPNDSVEVAIDEKATPDDSIPIITYEGPSLEEPLALGYVELAGTITDDSAVTVSVNGTTAMVKDGGWSHRLDVSLELDEVRIEATDEVGNEATPLVFTVRPSPSKLLASMPDEAIAAVWIESPTEFRKDIFGTPFDAVFREYWGKMSKDWISELSSIRKSDGIGQAPTLDALFGTLDGEMLISLQLLRGAESETPFLIQAHLENEALELEQYLKALVRELGVTERLAASQKITAGSGSHFTFQSGNDRFYVVLAGPKVFASNFREVAVAAAQNSERHTLFSPRFEKMRASLVEQRLVGSTVVLLGDLDGSFALARKQMNDEKVDPWFNLLGAKDGIADLGLEIERDKLSVQLSLPSDSSSDGLLSALQTKPFEARVLSEVPLDAASYVSAAAHLDQTIRDLMVFSDRVINPTENSQKELEKLVGENRSTDTILRSLGTRVHVYADTSSRLGYTIELSDRRPIVEWLDERFGPSYLKAKAPDTGDGAWNVVDNQFIFGHDIFVRDVSKALESGAKIERPELADIPTKVNAAAYANPSSVTEFFSHGDFSLEGSRIGPAVAHAHWNGRRYSIRLILSWNNSR